MCRVSSTELVLHRTEITSDLTREVRRTYSFRHNRHLDVNVRQSCGPSPILIPSISSQSCRPSPSFAPQNMCHHSKSSRRSRQVPFSVHRSRKSSCHCLFQAWLASRALPCRRGTYLIPGAQRSINESNIKLALSISRVCAFDLFIELWSLHPVRTTLMMVLHIVRAFFPAFRGYSQAMIVDEVSRA